MIRPPSSPDRTTIRAKTSVRITAVQMGIRVRGIMRIANASIIAGIVASIPPLSLLSHLAWPSDVTNVILPMIVVLLPLPVR